MLRKIQKNKIVFMGTPQIAACCLKALIDLNSEIEILAVVCQPDRPVGRKQESKFCPVKQMAIDNNIKVFQPNKVEEIFSDLNQLNPNLILTCAFGQFIAQSILDIPKYKCINLHASLLPKLRGGAPIHWAIINGLTETGFTLMYTIKKMDAGNIIKKFPMTIAKDETYKTLLEKMQDSAYDIIKNNITSLFNDKVDSSKQDESLATFAYNIKREDEMINWNVSAIIIDQKIRGLYDRPVASTSYNGLNIKIMKSVIVPKLTRDYILPGTIKEINKDGILVATSDNYINLQVIQLPSKTPMPIKDIINGKHPFVIENKFI